MLISALTAATVALPTCSWDRPGVDPYVGNVAAAVDHYADIPESTRAALKQRMARHDYDEIATIRRDSIEGQYEYRDLRDMHFGKGQVCRTVSRDKWSANNIERGLVYCEDGHCLIVPTVCNNVSRVTRSPLAQTADAAPPAAGAAPGGAAEAPLQFEPPGAGNTPSAPNEPAKSFASSASPAPSGPPGGAPGAFVPIAPAPGNWINGSGASGGGGGGGGWQPEVPSVPKVPLPPVPEPSTSALLAAGLALLCALARRGKRHGFSRPAGPAQPAARR